MKYECTMCGHMMEAGSPPSVCPACGNSAFRDNPYDSKCPHCGQGYFAADRPNFCVNCGGRICAPDSNPEVEKVIRKAAASKIGSASATTKTKASSSSYASRSYKAPYDWSGVKALMKVVLWASPLVGIWLGWDKIVWFWESLCEHWFWSAVGFWLLSSCFVAIMKTRDTRNMWSCFKWIDWDNDGFAAWQLCGVVVVFIAELFIMWFGEWVLLWWFLWYLAMWFGHSQDSDAIKNHPIATGIVVLILQIAVFILKAKCSS